MEASKRLFITPLFSVFVSLIALELSSAQSVCGPGAVCGFDLPTPCMKDPTTDECRAQYICTNLTFVNLNYCCETDNIDQCPHGGEDLTNPDCSISACDESHTCHTPDNVCCPAVECPPPATVSTGHCGDLCNTTSCRAGLMCCPTECGQECKSPVSSNTGNALTHRWWLPVCFRSKVDEIKASMNRLVDIFSVFKYCFSVDIVRQMAALTDCLRKDGPYSALKKLAVALETAGEDTTHIADAMTKAADEIEATKGDCAETDKIEKLVEHINFYATVIRNGMLTCSVPKVCRCHGDPHFTTFDKKKYTYAGEGPHYLLMHEDFTVVADFELCRPRRHVSCVKSVEITSITHGFKIHLGRHGNTPIETPPYIFMSTGGEISVDNFPHPDKVVVALAGGVEVTWDEDKAVEIFVPPHMSTKGMCGDNDGISWEDFKGPDGTMLLNANDFGQSWKVPVNEVPTPTEVPAPNPPLQQTTEAPPAAVKTTEAPPPRPLVQEISFK